MNILKRYKKDFSANLKLALPIMAGQLGQITVYLADNIMVGRLGALSLAAVSFAVALIALPIVIGMGIAFALPPLVSEADGSGEQKKISQYFKHSLVVNIGIGILSCIVMMLSLPFLHLLGQEPEVVEIARGYIYYSAWGMIPMMFFLTFRSYADGMSETMPPMIAMILGNVINIILNYILIYGKFGMPALGVDGAAISSLIARISMIVILIAILLNWKDLWNNIQECDFSKYQTPIFKKIFALGIPTSLQMFFEISAFSGAALIMGMVSSNAQAAHQIAINLSSITFMICSGLAMASTIRVGNQLGKKDYSAMRDAGISAFLQVALIMSIFSVLFVLLRHQMPLIYLDDKVVIGLASTLLIYAAVFQIPDGLQVAALAALRGIQDVKKPTLITFFSYYVFGIPISYFAALHWGMGATGVWLGLLVGLFISATLLIYRFHKLSKLNVLLSQKNRAF
ncbi:MAG: MATE family multidrug resistance protein [Saprospiraceae bacterium]|jgi:MATE family multidrug resistance protein